MRLETFSYLPPLTREQLQRQVEHILARKLHPAVEYTDRPGAHNVYWRMWKLPLFGARTADEVLQELDTCRVANPGCYIKLNGYDPVRQGQVLSFVAYRPDQEARKTGSPK